MADSASTQDEEARRSADLRGVPVQREAPAERLRVERDDVSVERDAPAPRVVTGASRLRLGDLVGEELDRVSALLRFVLDAIVDGAFFVVWYGLHVLLQTTLQRARIGWGDLEDLNDLLFAALLFTCDMLTLGVVIVFFVRDAVTAVRRIWKGGR